MKIARLVVVLFVASLLNGCAVIVSKQLRNALPVGHIGEAKVSANIVGWGGGSLEIKDGTKDQNGAIKAKEYHSKIITPGGSVTVDMTDAQVK